MSGQYDVLAFGAHHDDLEAVMGWNGGEGRRQGTIRSLRRLNARLPKWESIAEGEMLAGTEPHEIERLFFGHCRMELAWPSFDFAVDVTAVYERKLEALTV